MNNIPGMSNTSLDVFEPALFNDDELKFLAAHLGESPRVALHEDVPAHVNPAQVGPLLGRIYELEELRAVTAQKNPKEVHKVEWCGFKMVSNAIAEFQEWQTRCQDMHRRGGPKHPSMFTWDGDGAGHRYGPGSDSGLVRTMILADGTRKRFGITLTEAPDYAGLTESTFRPDWAAPRVAPRKLIEDYDKCRIECPICGYAVNFKKKERASFNLARGRVLHHLVVAKDEVGLHRATYTYVSSTVDARMKAS